MHAELRIGQTVRVRTRTWLVEDLEPSIAAPKVAHLACIDDDAQGQRLQVLWAQELDAKVLDEDAWAQIGTRGFDSPERFGAYLRTLRWGCVTATDPGLFQSPFRAGIKIESYQLEPLAKALKLPRVNLFIADDVGLGKTIEAGLIASELLLRRRVREIVVAAPPSMLVQWQEEMESRFGLRFEIFDRAYVDRIRRERGYSANPWASYPRFLISHRLLVDEDYIAPLRDWLSHGANANANTTGAKVLRPGTLLILDEAHHAAPSSGSRYAIDSKLTRALRDLAGRFEHRLFLSATPHNGHSNSFSALMELLDPYRFTRGIPATKANLEATMVRRLKEDLRQISGGFPERAVVQIDLVVPADAPELQLAELLQRYRALRLEAVQGLSKRKQAELMLVLSGLQQRLLSSIEAFARTLKVHRRGIASSSGTTAQLSSSSPSEVDLLTGQFDPDDDRAQLEPDEQAALLDTAMAQASANSAQDLAQQALDFLAQMGDLAEAARYQPDARVRYLLAWLNQHCCAGITLAGQSSSAQRHWQDRRVLIFTEYEDTQRYLVQQLRAACAHTENAQARIGVFHGPTSQATREELKRAFNAPPDEHPLRILVCTDAAREGLNLQAFCYDLFHFDLPWNPSRLEQRNGRIDRKLQRAPKVYCHYFVYPARPEDRVLQALVRKTQSVRAELGSAAQVLDARLSDMLRDGIAAGSADQLAKSIAGLQADRRAQTAFEELEQTRARVDALRVQIESMRSARAKAEKAIGLEPHQLQNVLGQALQLAGAKPLRALPAIEGAPQRFELPDFERTVGADPSWAATLASLRARPHDATPQRFSPTLGAVRPVVLTAPDSVDDSVVQLHLEHRVVKRLLGRFLAQGFVYHDLSRAVLAQSRDSIARVVLLGRLSLFGAGATRLHEELIVVTARWIDPAARTGALQPFGRDGENSTLELLERAVDEAGQRPIAPPVQQRIQDNLATDLTQLLVYLRERADRAQLQASQRLTERGESEAQALVKTLEAQRKRVLEKSKAQVQRDLFDFSPDEKSQLDSDRRYWERWLVQVEQDLVIEPDRIRSFYGVQTHRVEPLGIAYLWPVTG